MQFSPFGKSTRKRSLLAFFPAAIIAAALLLAAPTPFGAPTGKPLATPPSTSASGVPAASLRQDCFQIDDFEEYQAGEPPGGWYTNDGRSLTAADRSTMTAGHEYVVRSEGGNRFVRARMKNYAYRLIRLSGDHFPKWDTSECPGLAWRWRVQDVPEGADETDDDNNDVAAAVYVTFSRNWYGRPKSIKYTFSSTQPVGTTADYGSLKVLVVASAAGGNPQGEWMKFERDVVADYKNFFGEAPDDDTPLGIQLFSDADAGDGTRTAVADFDDVRVTRP